jgi:hypothetical protein
MKRLAVAASVVFLLCMAAAHEGVRDWLVAGLAMVAFVVACWAIAELARTATAAERSSSTPAGGGIPDASSPSARTPPAGHLSSP